MRGASPRLFPSVVGWLAAAGFAVLAHPAAALPSDDSTTVATDSLAASWEPPWNPSHPIPRRQAWERAVLLPGRILTLPLSAVGWMASRGLLVLEQRNIISQGSPPSVAGSPRPRAGLKLSDLGDRSGLGLGLQLRSPVPGGPFRPQLAAQYSATLHHYTGTALALGSSPVQLQYNYDWRPEERFYGLGDGAASHGASGFAARTESVRAGLRFGLHRAASDSLPRDLVAIWAGPRSAAVGRTREAGIATIAGPFPEYGAQLEHPVEQFVYGARVSADTRTGHPHWTRGWRVLVQAERFDDPVKALALHSATADGARFDRYEFEGETGFSFRREPRTVRVLVRLVDQNVEARADRFLVSDLASLGGTPGLLGYESERFHDLDLALGRITYIFPLSRRLEMDLHGEWGGVYHDVWVDPKPNTVRGSAGFAVRVRDNDVVLGSLGLDAGSREVRLTYTLGATP